MTVKEEKEEAGFPPTSSSCSSARISGAKWQALPWLHQTAAVRGVDKSGCAEKRMGPMGDRRRTSMWIGRQLGCLLHAALRGKMSKPQVKGKRRSWLLVTEQLQNQEAECWEGGGQQLPFFLIPVPNPCRKISYWRTKSITWKGWISESQVQTTTTPARNLSSGGLFRLDHLTGLFWWWGRGGGRGILVCHIKILRDIMGGRGNKEWEIDHSCAWLGIWMGCWKPNYL